MWIGAGQRRDVDDVTAAAPLHLRDRFVTAIEDAEQIRFEHRAKIFGRGLLNRFEDANTRVVDEDVESTQFFDRVIDEGLDLIVFANVADETSHTPATLNGESFRVNVSLFRLALPSHPNISWRQAQDDAFMLLAAHSLPCFN